MNFNKNFIEYIMNELKPTLGEIICDPAMNNGDLLVGAVEYLNEKHEDRIVWDRLEDTLFGIDSSYENVGTVRNRLQQFNISNTLFLSDSAPQYYYDVIMSDVRDINMITYIVDSLKTFGRAAMIVPFTFLIDETKKYIHMRSYLSNHSNIYKVISYYHYSIIFINKKSNTSQVYFYDLVERNNLLIEEDNTVLDIAYIQKNNYVLFDNTQLPPLIPCIEDYYYHKRILEEADEINSKKCKINTN